MQTNNQASMSVTEAQLTMNLGMACRLSLMPNLMKCPTVRQRVKELEQYLQNKQCSSAFSDSFVQRTGKINDISSMRINCFNRVNVFRLKPAALPDVHVCDRTVNWKQRQQTISGGVYA